MLLEVLAHYLVVHRRGWEGSGDAIHGIGIIGRGDRHDVRTRELCGMKAMGDGGIGAETKN